MVAIFSLSELNTTPETTPDSTKTLIRAASKSTKTTTSGHQNHSLFKPMRPAVILQPGRPIELYGLA
jgi:hypothetical protein